MLTVDLGGEVSVVIGVSTASDDGVESMESAIGDASLVNNRAVNFDHVLAVVEHEQHSLRCRWSVSASRGERSGASPKPMTVAIIQGTRAASASAARSTN